MIEKGQALIELHREAEAAKAFSQYREELEFQLLDLTKDKEANVLSEIASMYLKEKNYAKGNQSM